MPCDHAAMFRGLAEELIVKQSERLPEQLPRRHEEAWVPQDVVKRRPHTPGAEGVEEHGVGVVRFVAVIFIKQLVAVMLRIGHLRQFAAQCLDLRIIEQPDARYIAVLHKMRNLLRAQLMRCPFLGRGGLRKQVGDRAVLHGEVFCHVC